ncbi:MAG: 1-acyl-sn-glycerol-3-phosphate acyltransferase [Ferruginibacter sp.]
MLYHLLKIPSKIALAFYCRDIQVNDKAILQTEGPLLIASNHPNSFLDAIVIATLFKRPVYSLTRGDMYAKPLISRILYALKMFPVYRMSEGVENMEHNYTTFEKCKTVFKENGIVLIFSEGLCINEWKLRLLKKGTARLAISSWQDSIPLKVLPCGINYQAFKLFGKNIKLNFGETIFEENIDHTNGYGKTIQDFNEQLAAALKPLVIEVVPPDKKILQQKFYVPIHYFKKTLLAIPAALGYLFHAPLYMLIKSFTESRAGKSGHYDSILIALLFVCYPFYLLLLTFITYLFIPYAWWLLLLLPFCAWSYVQLKKQF